MVLTKVWRPVRRGADASAEAWRDGCGGRQDRGRGGRHWMATYNHLGRTRRPDGPHDPAATASWLRARPHHSATVATNGHRQLAWASTADLIVLQANRVSIESRQANQEKRSRDGLRREGGKVQA